MLNANDKTDVIVDLCVLDHQSHKQRQTDPPNSILVNKTRLGIQYRISGRFNLQPIESNLSLWKS